MTPRNQEVSDQEREDVLRDRTGPLRARTRRFAALGASLACLVLVACGDGGSEGGEEAPAAASPAEAPLEAEESDPLADLETRLDAAGFTVRGEDSTDAQAALSAGGVGVAFYKDPKRARVVSEEIREILRDVPGRGLVERHGHLVISIGRERKLVGSEKRRFREVVAIARQQRAASTRERV